MISLIVSSLIPSMIPLGIVPETVKEAPAAQNPTYSLEISQVPSTEPLSSPHQVIEVYYSDPQDIPVEQSINPLPEAEDTANQLGQPISVGTPENFTQVVENLDQTSEKLIPLEAKRLITRNREGDRQEYNFSGNPLAQNDLSSPNSPEDPNNSPLSGVIELIADQQEYDANNQVVIAKGNVVMRFANAVLLADRLRVNIPDRLAVAEGSVVLQRGDQTLRGEKFEYYFVQDRGVVF